MKKVVLALLVVLTAASVSFAGYTVVGNTQIEQVENGNALVETYLITLSVDDEGGITSISDIAVTEGTGLPVQLQVMGVYDTPDETYTALLAANAILDTHILDTNVQYEAGGNQKFGDGWTEANDLSDPAGLGATGYCGLGELTLANDPSTIAMNNPPSDNMTLEFIQVVVPKDKNVIVSGKYTNPVRSAAGLAMVPFEFTVGKDIPEPSTIVLLVMGALCLVGLRRRK